MLKTPAVNRRRLLLGLASASASGAAIVAAGVTVGAVTADTAHGATVAENPSLLTLGDQLPDAEAEMVAANAALRDVLRRWWSKWPVAPDAIVKPYRDDCALERGLDGSCIGPDGRRDLDKARPLFSSQQLAWDLDSVDRTMKRRRPRHPLSVEQLMDLEAKRAMLSDQLAQAREYEAAKARTLEASGYEAARDRQSAAREALLSIVSRIMAEPETSMAGVVIKAEALTAWANAPYHAFEVKGWAWPQQLAASLLRIAGEAPAEQA